MCASASRPLAVVGWWWWWWWWWWRWMSCVGDEEGGREVAGLAGNILGSSEGGREGWLRLSVLCCAEGEL